MSHVTDLTSRTQDYLKTILALTERTHKPAALSDISATMDVKMSTASEAIKRLGAQGLIHREPYQGITLTAEGRRLAVEVVRRHRLVETFLVNTLGYGWDEVHDEAEILEHAISDRLLGRIDAFLEFPTRDAHGAPIPSSDGELEPTRGVTLDTVEEGATVCLERIYDDDETVLRYLDSHRIGPGTVLTVVPPPLTGLTAIILPQAGDDDGDDHDPILLNEEAARCMCVIPVESAD